MNQLTINDLKVRGVGAIEAVLADQTGATISVQGKKRFVVMDVAQYHYCANANWKPRWPKAAPIWPPDVR